VNTLRSWAAALLLFTGVTTAHAHKPSDSYLTLTQPDSGVALAGQWDIALRDLEHAIGIDLDADGQITWGELRSRETAIASYALSRLKITGNNGDHEAACESRVQQLLVDEHVDGRYAVLRFVATCPTRPSRLAINYQFLFDLDPAHRGLLNVVAGGVSQASVLARDSAEAELSLAGSARMQQFTRFVTEGMWHIWQGYDHILFLLTLLLPAVIQRRGGRWEPRESLKSAALDVIKVVTAFTLAHSLTLTLATFGFVSLPSRWVESAIALTVLLGALNNLFPVVRERRWLVAFGFGLIHGLGFAAVLTDLGLTGWNLFLALLGFNAGVEVGQAAIVLVFVPLAYGLRGTVFYRKALMPAGAVAIGVLAMYWLAMRVLDLPSAI
jgi:hypothetical protein